jgi:hypothetical protein
MPEAPVRSDETKAFFEIADLCLQGLEPELERRELVGIVRSIYNVASDFTELASLDDEDDSS